MIKKVKAKAEAKEGKKDKG